MKKLIKKILRKILKPLIFESIKEDGNYKQILERSENAKNFIDSFKLTSLSDISSKSKIYSPYRIVATKIDDYTYVAENSKISRTQIGKFCSIGPNFLCGYGIHPTNGISTSPMFYSTMKQNGITLSETDKVEELKSIYIGNDVFIGMNVTVLDGVKIGDGAVIGAGALVSKDIPSYAIAVGNPIKTIRYRFTENQISQLMKIKWWDFEEDQLKDVERDFFNVEEFIKKYAGT